MVYLILLSLFLIATNAISQDNLSALIPMPNSIEQIEGGVFDLSSPQMSIYSNNTELQNSVLALQKVIKGRIKREIETTDSDRAAAIKLLIDPSIKGEEKYVLEVDNKGITISGASPKGVFYGVMTLDQLLLGDVCNTKNKGVAAVRIVDEPRFPFRALMIDPGRNFLPVKDIKFYIDQMVQYKYNTLQMHLTEDFGWRMEIKKYPKLTENSAFYTQEELKDLIAYAAERYVDIIPEIDVPGHTVAFLAAYPELACDHQIDVEKKVGKTVKMMLCAAKPQVYSILDDIIAEVATVFPSKYLHLGDDESEIDDNWAKCPSCKAMQSDLNYNDPSQLMIPFFDNILASARKNGKKPVLWCELNNIYPPADDYLFPYPNDVTLISWRGGLTPTSIELSYKNSNDIIVAPGEYAYLDYPQIKGGLPEFDNWGMPVTTLTKCYEFDPGYGRSIDEQEHILGIMGTLWGEAMKDMNRVSYMTYPRAFALAEAGWTEMEYRDWESFKERLYPNLMNLMKNGVPVYVPYELIERE